MYSNQLFVSNNGENIMLPLEKILCPTDFSDPSYLAIRTGAEMAQHFGAQLIVVHILEPLPVIHTAQGPLDFNTAKVEAEKRAFADKKLDIIIKHEVSSDVASQSKIDMGDPAQGIVLAAGLENVDLIVMATHGMSGWRKFFLGSVTEKVVRNAACPVLTIREPSEA
jgi:nucleotide-binding universal stress UspA family protein